MRWLLAQPDSKISVKENLRDMFATDYTLPWFPNPTHETLIRRDLTKQLGSLTAHVANELASAFNDYWGTETDKYTDVCVQQTMMKIVTRAANRMLVGLPLCEFPRTAEDSV